MIRRCCVSDLIKLELRKSFVKVMEDQPSGILVYASNSQQISADLKLVLAKLLNDQIDQFEVLSLAQRLSVDLSHVENYSKQKYLLQESVLEQILRQEKDNTDHYKKILEETRQNLDKEVSKKFLCCLIGCLFQDGKHRKYLKHLKQVHSTHDDLVCNFMHKCSRHFSSFKLLVDHVREIHSNVQVPVDGHTFPELVLDIPCR